MSSASDTVLFFGRLHPLLVHLPIGLIILLALLELLALFPRLKQANANAGVILAVAVPAAAFTTLCGWLLSYGGGYQESLLRWHQWTAIGVAALCVVAALLYWLRFRKLYRWCLFASFLVLLPATHFGGSLTHGSDYLTHYAPGPLRALLGDHTSPKAVVAPAKDPGQLQAFADVVQPLLQKDCVSCHGPEKLKGKLRLDSLAALLKGGGSGPAMLAGKSGESEMIRRLKLPSSDDDHMPPPGKPQPTRDEIALLEWWIDSGAPGNKKLAELNPNATIKRILETRFGGGRPAPKATPARALNDVLPIATQLSEQLHIAVSPISPKEPWLQCDAGIGGAAFGDAQLAQLAPLAANLRWLDLGGTAITDAGAAHIAAMQNLARLHLERTAISDAGLASLGELPNLEYLNLYGTAITSAGLEHLGGMPKLKHVYLWQTKVTPESAKQFTDARTDAGQLQRWQEQIEALEGKIKDAQISVDLGDASTTATATNPAPANAMCPVSGKPIDPTKTLVNDGTLVAFCCDICKAKFQKDPKPYLAKLELIMPKNPTAKPDK